jgi:hypothetical protein
LSRCHPAIVNLPVIVSDVLGDEVRVLDCGASVIQTICQLGAPAQNMVETC